MQTLDQRQRLHIKRLDAPLLTGAGTASTALFTLTMYCLSVLRRVCSHL